MAMGSLRPIRPTSPNDVETLRLDAIVRSVTATHGPRPDPGATLPVALSSLVATSDPLPRVLRSEPPPAPHSDFGEDFERLDLLGSGGMGLVYRARQRSLDREVALKSLRPEVVRGSLHNALVAEARVMGRLEHPGIIPVHALGRDEHDRPVLVMKRVSGTPWRALLHDPQHPGWARHRGDRLAFHLQVLVQVCNAVHFAHERGTLHRDIKPDNVMLGDYGEVYLVDWGLAYRPLEDAVSPEVGIQVVGTPAYMAPEMLEGTGPWLTPRTDLFLLGATLYEVLSGTVPHQGASLQSVIGSVMQCDPPVAPAGAPSALMALCTKAMARDPAQRVETARDFRDAILAYLERRPSEGLTDRAFEALAALEAMSSVAAAAREEAEVQARFAEASFGFRQALWSWGDNVRAQEGLVRAQRWMIGHALALRHAHDAAALLAQLRTPDVALEAAYATLRAELDAAARAAEAAQRVASRHDPQTVSRSRLRLVPRTLGSTMLAQATLGTLCVTGYWEPRGVHVAMVQTLSLGVIAANFWRNRTTAFAPGLQRRVSGTVLFGIAGMALMNALGDLLGAPVGAVVPMTFLVASLGAASLALEAFPVLWMVSGVYALTAVLGALVAHRAGLGAMFFTVALSHLVVAIGITTRWRREAHARLAVG